MPSRTHPRLTSATTLARARKLRREATGAEKVLWSELRNQAISLFKFRRQCPIGKYIVDFCCLSRKLIVEVDGSQHFERLRRYDQARTRELEGRGFRVMRFWNDDVTGNVGGVLLEIQNALEEGGERLTGR